VYLPYSLPRMAAFCKLIARKYALHLTRLFISL
jgi:hypothetical protein